VFEDNTSKAKTKLIPVPFCGQGQIPLISKLHVKAWLANSHSLGWDGNCESLTECNHLFLCYSVIYSQVVMFVGKDFSRQTHLTPRRMSTEVFNHIHTKGLSDGLCKITVISFLYMRQLTSSSMKLFS